MLEPYSEHTLSRRDLSCLFNELFLDSAEFFTRATFIARIKTKYWKYSAGPLAFLNLKLTSDLIIVSTQLSHWNSSFLTCTCVQPIPCVGNFLAVAK